MDPASVITIISGVLSLVTQVTPMLEELVAAIQSGDQAKLDTLLVKVQAANDVLGKA
ncbi:MAG: hypothetical protein JWQ97_2953 [Phenylobacterium sp.]|nr:hypothetical protein [Phenylobacterium sp.]